MRLSRLFVPPERFLDDQIIFSDKDLRYLRDVLRLGAESTIVVFDGYNVGTVQILERQKGRFDSRVLEKKPLGEAARRVVLLFGCVRPDPMEQILRHGVELGVTDFLPFTSERVNRKPQGKKDRWEKIITSAMAQSGNLRMPSIGAPQQFAVTLDCAATVSAKFILDSHGPPINLMLNKSRVTSVGLLVGPEGGLADTEIALAQAKGFCAVSLGAHTLRTETAALAAVAIVQAHCDTFEVKDLQAGFRL